VFLVFKFDKNNGQKVRVFFSVFQQLIVLQCLLTFNIFLAECLLDFNETKFVFSSRKLKIMLKIWKKCKTKMFYPF